MKTLAWLGVLGAAATLAACADDDYYNRPPPPPGAYYAAPPPPGAYPAPPPAGYYGAPASAVAPACFYTRDIRNHTVADDHTIFIDVAGRTVYRVETSNSCFAGATSTDPIVIRNPPGANNVCRPIDLDLGVNTGGFTSRCIVTNIVPMSPAEIAALPPKLRP